MQPRAGRGPYRTPGAHGRHALAELRARSEAIARRFARRRRWAERARRLQRMLGLVAAVIGSGALIAGLASMLGRDPPACVAPAVLAVVIAAGMAGVFSLGHPRARR